MSEKEKTIELLRKNLDIFKQNPDVIIKFMKDVDIPTFKALLRKGLPAHNDVEKIDNMWEFDVQDIDYYIVLEKDKKVSVGFHNLAIPSIGVKGKDFVVVENELQPDVVIQYFYETDEDLDPMKNGILFVETFTKNGKKGALVLDIFYEAYYESTQVNMYSKIFHYQE